MMQVRSIDGGRQGSPNARAIHLPAIFADVEAPVLASTVVAPSVIDGNGVTHRRIIEKPRQKWLLGFGLWLRGRCWCWCWCWWSSTQHVCELLILCDETRPEG